MALSLSSDAPTVFIRRECYESSGITRASIDERLGLTPEEFRVEGNLIAIGPLHGGGANQLGDFIAELEGLGLVYYDDFFELSGNWPAWLKVHASGG
jgi:hypothetical protein